MPPLISLKPLLRLPLNAAADLSLVPPLHQQREQVRFQAQQVS